MIPEQDRYSLHQVSVQISIRSLLARSVYKISIRALSAQISLRGLSARPRQDLFMRSLYKLSIKALLGRYIGKIPAADLYAMSLYKISIRGLLARSLYKLPIRGQRFLYEMPRLVRACAVEMHMDMSSEPRGLEIYRENAVHPRTATPVLCKLAPSKCTWTCHQSFLMREFTGKMPRAP